MATYCLFAKYLYRTDYNGLVDILIDQNKTHMRALNAECYCSNCVSCPKVMHALYYSCIKDNNLYNGYRFLNLVDTKADRSNNYSVMGQKIIEHLSSLGIEGNLCLLDFYITSASLYKQEGKIIALYQNYLQLAIQLLHKIDTMLYDPSCAYDGEFRDYDKSTPIFLDNHKVNPEIITLLEGFNTKTR